MKWNTNWEVEGPTWAQRSMNRWKYRKVAKKNGSFILIRTLTTIMTCSGRGLRRSKVCYSPRKKSLANKGGLFLPCPLWPSCLAEFWYRERILKKTQSYGKKTFIDESTVYGNNCQWTRTTSQARRRRRQAKGSVELMNVVLSFNASWRLRLAKNESFMNVITEYFFGQV